MTEIVYFPKIARLSRDCVITEKLDGTNAGVHIEPIENQDYEFADPFVNGVLYHKFTGKLLAKDAVGMIHEITALSKSRIIQPEGKGPKGCDNFGFARWVHENAGELVKLGPGTHWGEWWGSGIQRGYGLPKGEKRWSLFNVHRWADVHTTELPPDDKRLHAPACCHVVPVLYTGPFTTYYVSDTMHSLEIEGSRAAPGFMSPEGVIIYHTASKTLFKKTIEKDDEWKGKAA